LVVSAVLTLTHSAGLHAEMYAYPDKGQSAGQQQHDKRECQEWATQQTGVDPSKTPPAHRGVGDGAGGAAVGAAGGAAEGEAGEGAARGAIRGRLLGAGRHPATARSAATELWHRAGGAAARDARGLRSRVWRVPDGTRIHGQVEASTG